MPNPIQDNPGQHRFEWKADGAVAFIEYIDNGRTLALTHTEVPEALRGKGIAAILVRHALDFARGKDRKVDPQCSYVAKFIEQNQEYADLKKEG